MIELIFEVRLCVGDFMILHCGFVVGLLGVLELASIVGI